MKIKIRKEKLNQYLAKKFGPGIKINEFRPIGRGVYGTAYLLDFDTQKGRKRLVLKTMALGGFGHDHFADIAGILIWEHSVYGKLPKHISSYDVIGLEESGNLVSIGDSKEFYILVEEAVGKEYSKDLDEILERGLIRRDRVRVRILAEYLAKIHAVKVNKPELYVRRARDLVGHGEYIMGILDSYPNSFAQKEMTKVVKKCVDWWAKLKGKTHRLAQVHGDFHPFNILFKGNDFILLDRSRGEYGEPADDTTALTTNYIFWSFVKDQKLAGDFKELFDLFFDTYLKKTEDYEMLEVIQPYFAFRFFVVGNPIFYPNKWYKEHGFDKNPDIIRKKLFNLANNILDLERLDLRKINSYID
jgi:tRNA A-37 threonylcarbamoyl transferase component Bud32